MWKKINLHLKYHSMIQHKQFTRNVNVSVIVMTTRSYKTPLPIADFPALWICKYDIWFINHLVRLVVYNPPPNFTWSKYIYTIIFLKYIAVRKLQVAILARSYREMSQTVCIDCQYILWRVRVSVRPSIFYTRKTPKTSGEPGRPGECLFEWTTDRPLIASGTGE